MNREYDYSKDYLEEKVLCPKCKKHKPLYYPYYNWTKEKGDHYYGTPMCYKCKTRRERFSE